jgi:hypothetical protein
MSNSLLRLTKIPSTFGLHDLTKEGTLGESLQRENAKKFVSRMLKLGVIQPAGKRAGVYYNLVRDPSAAQNERLVAVSRLFPEAIVIGISVLHAYGWVTQIPHTIDVAISSSRRTVPEVNGVCLRRRNAKWFSQQQAADAILRTGESPFYLDSLTPRAALEDVRKNSDIWQPDDDDLSIPDDDEEHIERIYRPRI